MNIETKSIPNFFQVSVNTEKLNQFFVAVSTNLGNHDKQIQQLTKQMIQLKMQMQQKVSKIKNQFEYQKQRADKKRRDDDTFFNSLVQDSTRKQQKLVQQTNAKFTVIEQELRKIKSQPISQIKINQFQKQLIEQMEKRKVQIDNDLGDINSKIKTFQTELKNNSSTQDFLLKNMIHAYQNRGKNNSQKQKNTPQQQVIILRPNRQQTIKDQITKGKAYSIQKSVNQSKQAKQAKERKRRKIQQKNEFENLQYASVSAKIDALDLRLTAKENQSLNKVMWAGKNTYVSSESSQKDLENSVDRIEFQSKNLQYRITTKLEHIEKIIYQKIAFDEKELNKLKNLGDLLKDQMEIANRRIQKESLRITDCFLQFKKIEDKRVDQKIIDNFITMFKRQLRLLEEQIELRIRKEDWQKQQNRFMMKIDFLSETLTEKAEKQEVKKAFRFIQDKIKEIVLIMAEEQQAERDGGAGKKIPFKCLSCDKQLESSTGTTQRPHLQNRLASRGSTSNLRKRIRAGHAQEK